MTLRITNAVDSVSQFGFMDRYLCLQAAAISVYNIAIREPNLILKELHVEQSNIVYTMVCNMKTIEKKTLNEKYLFFRSWKISISHHSIY